MFDEENRILWKPIINLAEGRLKGEGGWEAVCGDGQDYIGTLCTFSAQIFCDPETALKKNCLLKREKEKKHFITKGKKVNRRKHGQESTWTKALDWTVAWHIPGSEKVNTQKSRGVSKEHGKAFRSQNLHHPGGHVINLGL